LKYLDLHDTLYLTGILRYSEKNSCHMTKTIDKCFIRRLARIALPMVLLVFMSPVLAGKPTHPRVVIEKATQGITIDEVRLSGTVSSPRVTRLSTEVSGLVKNITVDAGTPVNAGDVLMSLDTELEELSMQSAQATALRAKEELADAQRRFEEGKRLAKKKTLSASELESLKAEVNITRATLQHYTAEERLQRAKIQRHQLTAPFKGVISQKFVEIGEWIQPGTAVVELVANEDLRIDFQVSQNEYPRIKTDSDIRIRLDAMPDKILQGVIQTIVPYSDSDARTFLLRVTLSESNPAIVPGMSASGLLRLKTETRGIVISRDAIIRHPDGRITVWVVNKSNNELVVSEQRVTIGSSFNGKVSIRDGLQSGDQIVVEGNESLRDGQTVILHKQ